MRLIVIAAALALAGCGAPGPTPQRPSTVAASSALPPRDDQMRGADTTLRAMAHLQPYVRAAAVAVGCGLRSQQWQERALDEMFNRFLDVAADLGPAAPSAYAIAFAAFVTTHDAGASEARLHGARVCEDVTRRGDIPAIERMLAAGRTR